MKARIIKISILVAVIGLAIFGVYRFKQTQAPEPPVVEFKNPHLVNISQSIKSLSSDSLEVGYEECIYILRRSLNEGLIDSVETSEKLKEFVNAYTPKFIANSQKAFNKSEWDKEPWDHDFMNKRISELYGFKISNGSVIIEKTSDLGMELDNISNIIKRYDEAIALSKLTKYKSLAVTKERESKAESYKMDSDLCKCTSLVKALNELPGKIKESHKKVLIRRAKKLSCNGISSYGENEKEGFQKKLKGVRDDYDEYKGYYNSENDIFEALKGAEERALQTCIDEVKSSYDSIYNTSFDNSYDYNEAKNRCKSKKNKVATWIKNSKYNNNNRDLTKQIKEL